MDKIIESVLNQCNFSLQEVKGTKKSSYEILDTFPKKLFSVLDSL